MSSHHILLNAELDAFKFHVNLQFDNKSILGIFGHSAAGKTLLLRSIAGLEKKIEGRIVINSTVWQDTENNFFLPTHKRTIGYVFQEPRLLPQLTAKKNLCFAINRGRDIKTCTNYENILEILKISDCLERYPHQLSGGEQQRIAIARAVLSNPDMLLMDEPLSALDKELKEDILVMIKRLASNLKISILYVSHDYSEIMKIADHITLVQQGSFSQVSCISKIFHDPSSAFLHDKDSPSILFGTVRLVSPTTMLIDTELGALYTENFDSAVVGQMVRVAIYPRDIELCAEELQPKGSNFISASIQSIDTSRSHFAVIILAVGAIRLLCHIPLQKSMALCLQGGMSLLIQIKKLVILRS